MDEPHPTGLKPTLRQMMIFIVWAALLSAIARAAASGNLMAGGIENLCLTIPVCIGIYPMPILAGLLWALDRPGQVRRW